MKSSSRRKFLRIIVKGTDDQTTFLRSLKPKLGLSDYWKAAHLGPINLALYKISFVEFCSKVKVFSTKYHAWHSMSVCWIKTTLGICFATPGKLVPCIRPHVSSFFWISGQEKLCLPWKTEVFLSSSISTGSLLPTNVWVCHLRPFIIFQALSPTSPFIEPLFQANGTTIPSSGCLSLLCSELFLHLKKETYSFFHSSSQISLSMKPLGMAITDWMCEIAWCSSKNMVSQTWDGTPGMPLSLWLGKVISWA